MNTIRKIRLMRFFNLEKVERQVIIPLALVVFVIAMLLLSSISLRWDLSYGRAYTLSPATRTILHNLDDIVTITFISSSELPTRLVPLKSEVQDLLAEYKKAGGSKITVRTLDPKKDSKAADMAREYGMPEIQFSQVERDKYAVTAAHFGIVMLYGNKQELIPQATDLDSLEYNITAAIYKMTRKELPKIGVVGLEPVFDPRQDPIRTLKSVLEQQFIVEPLLASPEEGVAFTIDPSYKAVLVFDTPGREYTDEERAGIKQYIAQKGNVIFFVDGVWVEDSLATQDAAHGLSDLIRDYGITINSNLLLSTAAELVNFGNESVQFMVPYPFWLKTNSFNDQVSYFSNVGQMTFPWASSVTIAKKSGVEVDEIIKTTRQSWEQRSTFSLNPQSIPDPDASQLKEFTVGARARIKDGGQVIVVPSSRFILDRFLSRNSGNIAFALNVLNDVASGGALTGIAQRSVRFYPLPDLPETQKDIFKYGNALLLPSLIALYGAARLWRRK